MTDDAAPAIAGQEIWRAFDRAWYWHSHAVVDAVVLTDQSRQPEDVFAELAQSLGHAPNPYFSELWYLARYPGVKQAVLDGHFRSGFDHFCQHGRVDLSPHWLFDPWYYTQQFMQAYGRVFDRALDGDIYDHFLRIGQYRKLSGHWLFDPCVYADLAPIDVALRIRRDGAFKTFLHHIHAGGAEPVVSNLFDPAWYTARYSAVSQELTQGRWVCALHHYLANDDATRFDPNPRFSESAYVGCHAGVAEAVTSKQFRNGFEHFLRHGKDEGQYYAPAGAVETPPPAPQDPKATSFPLQKRFFDEVIFLPVKEDAGSSTRFSFGVLDRNGEPIRAFDHKWFEMRSGEVPVRREPGIFIYGGVLTDHFGHFLVDGLPNLWFVKEHPDLPVLWHWDPFAPLDPWPSWIDQIWRLLGLDRHRHIHILAPLSVDRVILPDSGMPTIYGLHPKLVRALAVHHCTKPWLGNRVWFSRRALSVEPDKSRRTSGEHEVEAILGGRGWTIIRPEDLPVADQIDTFATAEVVAGCIGSAFHAVLLSASPRARLILVDRPGIGRAFYDAIARALDLQQGYVLPDLIPYTGGEPGLTFEFADPVEVADNVCLMADKAR
jgi:hypothetical protein